jgi:hypothetical protein
LQFLCVVRAHQSDIGGATHGGYNPSATEIWQEGIRIPPIRLGENDSLREDLVGMLALNTRIARDFRGDLAMGGLAETPTALEALVANSGCRNRRDRPGGGPAIRTADGDYHGGGARMTTGTAPPTCIPRLPSGPDIIVDPPAGPAGLLVNLPPNT